MSKANKETHRDQIFSQKLDEVAKFKFDENVANVFDDMVSRSVPFYHETHRILLDILDRAKLPQKGAIYDLGCSTGETLCLVARHQKQNDLIGLDSSPAMIEKSQSKYQKLKRNDLELTQAQFHCEDIRKINQQNWPTASMIIMNYTLQFVPLEDRDQLLRDIYDKLDDGGVFFLAEKVKSPSKKIESLLTELYYDFKKRNGYSDLEISQKREALDNVLIPVSSQRQIAMMREAGFQEVDMVFRWYNFACYIGIK